MTSRTLTEQVRERLLELSEAKKFSQTKVARRLKMAPSAVNRTVRGLKAITLTELEVIADEAKVPVAELIAPPGTIKQVSASEAELLRYVRSWPKSVTEALLSFLRFYADETPVETQTRNVHEFWRRMPLGDRMWIYGVMQMVREGMLPQDLREGLIDQIQAGMQRRKGSGATKRPKDRGDDAA